VFAGLGELGRWGNHAQDELLSLEKSGRHDKFGKKIRALDSGCVSISNLWFSKILFEVAKRR